MAAGRKEYELQMKLTAQLGSTFGSSFQGAMSTIKKLQGTLQSVKKVQGDISAYKKTQEAINATKTKVQEYESKHDALQSELEQTAQKEKDLQAALKESEKATGKDSEEYKELQKQLQETRDEESKLKSQIKENERATESANDKIKEEEQNLSELSDKLKAAGINTDKLTQENDKLKEAYNRVKKAQEDYARVNSAIEQNKQAISATKGELMKTVGVIGTAGAAFYKGFIEPQANFEAQMSNVKALISSSVKGDQLDSDMKKLTKLADEMGATTKFTATEAGQALEYMGMAGWKTAQMVKGLPGIMNLAAASGEELATVSDIVTDAMTAFGMAADGTTEGIDNVTYFTDILAATASNSNTNVAKLGESFKYAAPLAGAFGFSVKDTSLMLGLMANAGIKESQSGTSLRKIFTALSSDLKIMQKDGSEFVVATQNADGSMRDLKAIVDDVRKAFNGVSDTDMIKMQKDLTATAQSLGIELNDENGTLKTQAALYAEVQDAVQNMTDAGKVQEAEAIASKTAMAGLLSIVNASAGDYNTLAEAIDNANGTAKAMADIKQDNLIGSITLMKSAWDGLARAIGKDFEPTLRSVIDKTTEFLTKAKEWVDANPQLIKQIGKVVAGFAGLKVGFLATKLGFFEMEGGILKVVKKFIELRIGAAESAAAAATGGGKFAAFGKKIAGYFSGVKSSVGDVGAAINKLSGGVLGKFGGFVGKAFKNVFSGTFGKLGGFIGNSFKNVFGEIGGKISEFFGPLGQKIAAGSLGKLGGVFGSLGKSIGPVLGGPLKALGGLFGGLFGKVAPIIAIVSALSIALLKLTGTDISSFIEPFKTAFEQLKPVLQTAMAQFQQLGKDLMPFIIKAARDLAPLLGQIITAILPVIIQLIENLVPIICQLVKDILPIVLSLISAILPILTSIITDIMPIFSSLLEAILPIISQLVKDVLPIIISVIETLLPPIQELIKAVLPILMSILQALMPIIQALAELFGGVLGSAIEAIKPIIESLTGVLKGIIDFITGVFTGDWEKAFGGIVDIAKNIWETIKNIFGGIIDFFKGIGEGIGNFFSNLFGGKQKVDVDADIPQFESGSDSTPDTFIAGDVNGKGGELVTGARGRKVFTAAETATIFNNIKTAKAINESVPRQVLAAQANGSFRAAKDTIAERAQIITPAAIPAPMASGGETKFEINYNPTIYVDGNKPGDLEEKLQQNNEKLMQMFKEYLRQQNENERRTAYA